MQQIKENLNLPQAYTHHDTKLLRHIFAATEMFEDDTFCICMEQTYDLILDELLVTPIDLFVRPVVSIESITYHDEDDVQQTVDSATYRLSTARRQVYLAPNTDWPSHNGERESVVITFKAGVPTIEQVPRMYQQGISFAVGAFFADPLDDRQADQWKTAYTNIVHRFFHEKEI